MLRESTFPEARHGLPLLLAPEASTSPAELADWLASHRDWSRAQLRTHGALLFRGFDVRSPAEFERVARGVEPDLENEYLGTSPRDALTDYVFSASELPGYYPIPQHCEMTFTRAPPRRIFFHCDIAPADPGGETPLVDFRRVLRGLRPEVRARFEERGLRIIRNYHGPGRHRRDLWQLKRWDEMFGTADRDAVTARARAEGFEPVWGDRDRLTLISTHDAVRAHPDTGEPVWFNHAQVFHLSTGPSELGRIFRFRPSARGLFWWSAAALLAAGKRRTPAEQQALHCTHRDGGEIDRADLEHVRDVTWEHLVVFRWRRGDVLAVDNGAIGHGRLPYRGPRRISVCWA